MYEVSRKLDSEYFDEIELNINVDDLDIVKVDGSYVNVVLNILNTCDDEISKHFIDSYRYEINMEITNRILTITYVKHDLLLLDDIEYIELIGCMVYIPEDCPYKIINNETENK